jgi:succinate dehydrogenase/fumarate reductase cytochrome b subunit
VSKGPRYGYGTPCTRIQLEEDVLPLAILLIIIGIVLAILVHYALGIVVILIGLVMLLLPQFRGAGSRRV